MAQFQRVVFITQLRFSDHHVKSHRIDFLRSRGIDVQIIEIDSLLNWQKDAQSNSGHAETHRPKTYKEFSKLVKQLNNDSIFICLFWYDVRFVRVFRVFTRQKSTYALNLNVTFPKTLIQQNLWLWFKSKLNVENFLLSLFIRMPSWIFGVRPPNYILTGGDKTSTYPKAFREIPRILKLHTFDYDDFLSDQTNNAIKEITAKDSDKPRKYVVFLDQLLPEHPDLIQIYGQTFIAPEMYYEILSEFFDRFEAQHGIEVVIAVHPRDSSRDLKKRFGQRRTYLYRTSELVRDSEGVLLHYSASVSFVVLYKKPCLLLDFSEFRSFPSYLCLDVIGKLLKAQVVDLRAPKIPMLAPIDNEAYESFRNDYIKSKESENFTYWELFFKETANEHL